MIGIELGRRVSSLLGVSLPERDGELRVASPLTPLTDDLNGSILGKSKGRQLATLDLAIVEAIWERGQVRWFSLHRFGTRRAMFFDFRLNPGKDRDGGRKADGSRR